MVCRYEAREDIDQALITGEPLRDIAGRTGMSKSALDRHKKDHLSATLVKAAESRDLAHGDNLLDRVKGLVEKALASLERAEGKGNEREVQGAIRETRHSLELVGRITGELHDKNRDNAPETALDAIIKLAAALSEAQLRGIAAGENPEGATIEVEGHVVR